jgi:tRNA(Ile)-lysidine synthetase-like protein
VLTPRRVADPDVAVGIEGVGAGQGIARLDGLRYRVRWSPEPLRGEGWTAGFSLDAVRFPLTVRGWLPGDRVRLPYGTKKLKKLFLEARVPPGRRHRIPVLADAAGGVLWVPEVVRSAGVPEPGDEEAFHIAITHADSY